MRRVFGTIALLILSTAASPAFEPLFYAGSNYNAGIEPFSIAVSDYNGDGHIDLAVINATSNDVSILLGVGDATFITSGSFPAGDYPYQVIAGDFDEDGSEDLAIANYSDSVSILLGNGDGTFGPVTSYHVTYRPVSISKGDFDEDGHTDLAVAREVAANASILRGIGDGTFAPPINIGSGMLWTYSVVTGDFNEDGHADLAFGHEYEIVDLPYYYLYGEVLIYLGNGDCSFDLAERNDAVVNAKPWSVAIGDFNQDGHEDLISANGYGDEISILLGMGDGTFAPIRNYTVDNAWSVVADDFDGDGDDDIAISSYSYESINVSVRISEGDGTFPTFFRYGAGDMPHSIVTGDFDEDGFVDLAVANSISNNMTILRGEGDGRFVSAENYGLDYGDVDNPYETVTGDFNEDGYIDVAVANSAYSGYVSIMTGVGDGTFSYGPTFAAGCYPSSIEAGDFDENGDVDLAVANWNGTDISILLGTGDGSFAPAVQYAGNERPISVIIEDFNEDGHVDLAVANYISDDISILLGAGNGTFAPAVHYGAGDKPLSITTGDFDEDGHKDLVAANGLSDDVSILFGGGDGTFDAAESITVGDEPWSVTIGDFNEDGNSDLAVVNAGSNDVSILLGTGDGTFAPAVSYGAGNGPHNVAAADLDNDGHADLAVANWDGTDITILLGAGDGTFTADGIGRYASSGNPYSIETGDLDGDGDIDLVLANRGIFEDGIVSVLLNLTADKVSTMLQSYLCFWNGEGIEISWTLSKAGRDMDLTIHRQSEGAEGFILIGASIIKIGELSYRVLDNDFDQGSSYRYRVDVTDEEGTRTLFVTEYVQVETPKLALGQNYPNPFNPSTVIRYSIPGRGHVTLDIYDISGRGVVRLVDEMQEAGVHIVEWSGRNADRSAVSSGVYFYRLTAGKKSVSKKMILLR